MKRPRRSLGRHWATSILPEGSILAVLKSFYDCSGQESDAFLTLSGVAANDDVWAEVETRWNEILTSHTPTAAYFHSVEAAGLRGIFKRSNGWDDAKVEGLTSNLLVYLTTLDRERYCQFSATVNMVEYKDLQAKTYQMRSPAELCTEYCTDLIMNWYVSKYRGFDVEAAFYFDNNEPFEAIFKAEWEHENDRARESGVHSIWSHIVHVGSTCKEMTPGIQIADMFAWGVNRVISGNMRFAHMAPAMNTFTNSRSIMLGGEYLRRRFRPLIWL